MKGAKSAKKKIDMKTVDAALKREALKSRILRPNLVKAQAKQRFKTKSAEKSEVKSAKSARSSKGSTALTTKSDPVYMEGADLEKDMKTNIEKIMKKSKSAEKKLESSTDEIKEKVKKYKKKKVNGVKNGY